MFKDIISGFFTKDQSPLERLNSLLEEQEKSYKELRRILDIQKDQLSIALRDLNATKDDLELLQVKKTKGEDTVARITHKEQEVVVKQKTYDDLEVSLNEKSEQLNGFHDAIVATKAEAESLGLELKYSLSAEQLSNFKLNKKTGFEGLDDIKAQISKATAQAKANEMLGEL